MSHTHAQSSDARTQAIVRELGTIHERAAKDHQVGEPGLYSRIMVIVDDEIPAEGDAERCYLTPVAAPRSGQGYYTLTAADGAPCPEDVSPDEARLSQQDSEVATLLEAYDWISDQGLSVATESIQVILISNIGPCTGCKARLQIFYADLVAKASEIGKKVSITVASVYNTAEASRDRTRGDKIGTTYGYPDAVKTPYSFSGQQGAYWLFRLPGLK
ncbi:hypothetical protein E1292_15340 [Nonomuraea deserti]|uniref:APOBEC-like N-terminal domain-containing protein n=1 Tax=Nonomuraea deserti TaxID=1848322 RepID=A0A4R4VKK6_9ACTN|nr:hypothetical protein [Nonomuraea deserti]TDD06269.1 hypothetical protein E1292_15340 [Nonomuraea deserti]